MKGETWKLEVALEVPGQLRRAADVQVLLSNQITSTIT